jgi:aminoglycoside N3'-acetyltransferase
MGIMTELFRRTKGVIQSRHPVYRVAAIGPLAKELTEGHEYASGPAGFGSPFEFMATHNTMVIGIGKSFHVMTQVHHVDELMEEDFPLPRTPKSQRSQMTVTVIDGDEKIPTILKDSGIEWRFNIAKLPKLLQPGDLKYWKFHNTPLFAARAKDVTESLVKAAKQGKTLYDPI